MIYQMTGGGNLDNCTSINTTKFASYSSDASSYSPVYISVLCYDLEDNMYLADSRNGRVLKVNKNNELFVIAGSNDEVKGYSGDGGAAVAALLGGPWGLASDPRTGDVYISDTANKAIRRISYSTGIINTIWDKSYFQQPTGLVFVGLNLFVVDEYTDTLNSCNIVTMECKGVAGYGTKTEDGSDAYESLLIHPRTVNADADGNLLIAGLFGSIKLLNTTTERLYTIVGADYRFGFSGDGGLAVDAALDHPRNAYANSDGDLFIADANNFRVRRVDRLTGMISTFAGTGDYGYNGEGRTAKETTFSWLNYVSVDSSDNVVVADSNNGCVRKIDKSTLVVSNLVSVCDQSNIEYSCPLQCNASGFVVSRSDPCNPLSAVFKDGGTSDIVTDSKNNIYMTDYEANLVRKLDNKTGILSVFAGDAESCSDGPAGDGGLATDAQLNSPFALAVDLLDNVLITERKSDVIRKVDGSTGLISKVAGVYGQHGYSGDGGPANEAKLNGPRGIVVGKSGTIYFCDSENFVVRKIDTNGVISKVAGNSRLGGIQSGDGGSALEAGFRYPRRLVVDNKERYLFVSDEQSVRLIDLHQNRININSLTCTRKDSSQLRGITMDSENKYLYVTDMSTLRAYRVSLPFDTANCVMQAIAGDGSSDQRNGEAQQVGLKWPNALRYNNHTGDLLVSDQPLYRKIINIHQIPPYSYPASDESSSKSFSMPWFGWLAIAIGAAAVMVAARSFCRYRQNKFEYEQQQQQQQDGSGL